MARDDQGDAVGGHTTAHGPGGTRGTCLGRKLAIGQGFAIPDALTVVNNPTPEVGPWARIDANRPKIDRLTGCVGLKTPDKVFAEPTGHGRIEQRRIQRPDGRL